MDEAKPEQMSVAEEGAFQLSQAAVKLDQARNNKDGDSGGLVDALNQNLEVWVAMRSIVMREDCPLSSETKDNLIKLSKFVAEKTFAGIDNIADSTLESLININLQISEGLLEGHGK